LTTDVDTDEHGHSTAVHEVARHVDDCKEDDDNDNHYDDDDRQV